MLSREERKETQRKTKKKALSRFCSILLVELNDRSGSKYKDKNG